METQNPPSNPTTAKPAGETFKDRQCCLCYKPVRIPIHDPYVNALDVKCDDCVEKEHAATLEAARLQREARAARALAVVPNLFNETQRERLPMPAKLDEAMRWEFGCNGILLWGPTGCGKSRIAWEIAKREIKDGRSFQALSYVSLMRYPSMLMGSGVEAMTLMDSLMKSELVLMDDVFKAKPTERIEELIFAVIDERANTQRPCVITLNDSSESLESRLSSDRGPALIRRLKEFCHVIQFPKP